MIVFMKCIIHNSTVLVIQKYINNADSDYIDKVIFVVDILCKHLYSIINTLKFILFKNNTLKNFARSHTHAKFCSHH